MFIELQIQLNVLIEEVVEWLRDSRKIQSSTHTGTHAGTIWLSLNAYSPGYRAFECVWVYTCL